MSLLVTPASVLAEDHPFQGVVTVAWAVLPNTNNESFCGGPAMTYVAEAHGGGSSSLGFLSLTLKKSVEAVGPMHGCLTLTDVNGDMLFATYDGTEGDVNEFGFQFGTGTLTFTGGTGRFRHARGRARFTASFSFIEMGTYLFKGSVSLPNSD